MKLITFCGLLSLVLGCNCHCSTKVKSFSDSFIFGAATASYQIEGAWNEDGKSENIWDFTTHNKPYLVNDRSNGDIAADSYHNYKRDVEMMRELGLDAYRFSFSWPRLLPTGFTNYVNPAGVAFYNNYIDEMIKYNITPMATLYHWDLPQKLQDLGGFSNPLFADWFEDYARVAYELFGDRVKYWITFNEPKQICYYGYGSYNFAPLVNATGIGEYLCNKNMLLGHARAYHAYNNDFKPTQGGKCGITMNYPCLEEATDTEEDRYALELRRQADFGMYSDPIFNKNGGYPKELEEIVARKSAEQGFPRSRMPPLSEEERKLIQGSSDFLGLNIYSGSVVSASEYIEQYPVPSIDDDISVGIYRPSEWVAGASGMLTFTPKCMYKILAHLQQRYVDPAIVVTENGWATNEGLVDEERVYLYRTALDEVLDAIDEGVNVFGYMAWSLLDNFEWMRGYTQRFGLYEVDFKSPARTRTPRKSAFVYKQIIKSRVIDETYEPDITQMTIDNGH